MGNMTDYLSGMDDRMSSSKICMTEISSEARIKNICITESLCCTPETLHINYTSIKMKIKNRG